MPRAFLHTRQLKKALRQPFRVVLINIAVLGLLFVLMEGLLSAILLSSDLLTVKLIRERVHTQHDPDLGWAPIRNLHLPNMYGPGIFLRTNGQGLRGVDDHPEAAPPGKRRIICSGDSVIFGTGVNDDEALCRQMEALDPRLETLNMGVPGYGVDQAYLWYKRDAARFAHEVHLLAAITDDLRRMQSTDYGGYGRPFLVVESDQLAVTNVPVPVNAYRLPWLTETRRQLWSLRSAEAIRRLGRRLSGSGTAPATVQTPNLDRQAKRVAADQRTVVVMSKLLLDLKKLNAERGSTLVMVYLPTLGDRGPDTEFWTGVLEAECAKHGIPFIDLVPVFEAMPAARARALYLPDLGHFNAEGNNVVAQLIYQRLAGIPPVARALFGSEARVANRSSVEPHLSAATPGVR